MMRTTPIVLLLILALAGCAAGPKPLARPDGEVFRLNPERWGDTVNDLRREARR